MKNWIRFKDTETKKIFYQQEEGFKGLTIYLEGVINAPIINLFAVLAEV